MQIFLKVPQSIGTFVLGVSILQEMRRSTLRMVAAASVCPLHLAKTCLKIILLLESS